VFLKWSIYYSPEESIVAKTQELKSKDGGIDTLENVAGEMSQNIAALQSEIASLQVICYQRHTTFYLFFRNLLRK
jgi:hypothetical protein